MGAVFGRKVTVSILGESHGVGIGCVLSGLPAGIKIDLDYINQQMQRRAPGKSQLATARHEADEPEIISGVFNGYTTGAPLTMFIKNNTHHSKDYSILDSLVRPGHADYGAKIKYNGFSDYRGGGHFSGRLTAPLVFAGAIAKLVLQEKNIKIGAHIKSVGLISTKRTCLDNIGVLELLEIQKKPFPVLDNECSLKMQDIIMQAKQEGDSVGGTVECAIYNVPPGMGENFFDSLESQLSSMLFSIPAVKALEFGLGFGITELYGSQSNDQPYYDGDGNVAFRTNNNGGIVGGISNGAPIVFRVGIKPTPSIYKAQNTINIKTKENTNIAIEGRHDPCIVPRAVPVVEAVAAWVMLDNIL